MDSMGSSCRDSKITQLVWLGSIVYLKVLGGHHAELVVALLRGVDTQLATIIPATSVDTSIVVQDKNMTSAAAYAAHQLGHKRVFGQSLRCHAQLRFVAKAKLTVRIGAL